MQCRVSIIDYGMGNLNSVLKSFKHTNNSVSVTSNWRELEKSDKIILVGVGHFAKAMQSSKKNKMVDDAIFKLKTDLDTGAWSDKFGKEIANMKNYDGGYRIVSFVKK